MRSCCCRWRGWDDDDDRGWWDTETVRGISLNSKIKSKNISPFNNSSDTHRTTCHGRQCQRNFFHYSKWYGNEKTKKPQKKIQLIFFYHFAPTHTFCNIACVRKNNFVFFHSFCKFVGEIYTWKRDDETIIGECTGVDENWIFSSIRFLSTLSVNNFQRCWQNLKRYTSKFAPCLTNFNNIVLYQPLQLEMLISCSAVIINEFLIS